MDLIAIAKLHSAFGLKGAVKASSFSGEVKHILSLKTVQLKLEKRTISLEIEEIHKSGNFIIIKFKGYDSPEKVKELANGEILVPRDQGAPCRKDEFYYDDLIGCGLVFENKPIGTVLSVFEAGTSDILEVRLQDDSVKNIPFRNEFIGKVDIKGKTVELLCDWILE